MLLVVAAAVAVLVPAAPAPAAPVVAPAGWAVATSEALAPGVEHAVLRRSDPAQEVHVARLAAGSGTRLAPVPAGSGLGALERTSALCARVNCVVAVNGDFWDANARPVGALVAGGELLTTPALAHVHLTFGGDGSPALRHGLAWSATVATLDGHRLAAGAVNRPTGGDGVTIYTRRWGPTTGTPAGTAEVSLDLVLPSPSALPTGTSAVRAGPATTAGNTAIGPNQVVVAGTGSGAAAVSALAARAAGFLGGLGTLTVDLAGVQAAIGGSPLLLHNGSVAYPADNPDAFTQDRHARTLVGVTGTGELLLVTVDATDTSAGMSLREASELMSGLGAAHAMNLDGGGSTTFVTAGQVRNRPAHGERPVVSALALLPQPADPLAALLDSLLGGRS